MGKSLAQCLFANTSRRSNDNEQSFQVFDFNDVVLNVLYIYIHAERGKFAEIEKHLFARHIDIENIPRCQLR